MNMNLLVRNEPKSTAEYGVTTELIHKLESIHINSYLDLLRFYEGEHPDEFQVRDPKGGDKMTAFTFEKAELVAMEDLLFAKGCIDAKAPRKYFLKKLEITNIKNIKEDTPIRFLSKYLDIDISNTLISKGIISYGQLVQECKDFHKEYKREDFLPIFDFTESEQKQIQSLLEECGYIRQ